MVLVQIQDEVVLRSKPNFSQKWLVPFHAESLSFREYRDRSTVSVSSNLQDVFLSPTRLSTFPPLPPLFLPLDRSTILTRIYIGRESTTLVFLERKKERKREDTRVHSGSRYLVELEDRESVRFHRWCVCER